MSVWLLCTCFKFRIRRVLKRQLGLKLECVRAVSTCNSDGVRFGRCPFD